MSGGRGLCRVVEKYAEIVWGTENDWRFQVEVYARR